MKKIITLICSIALAASLFAAEKEINVKGFVLQDQCSIWKENENGEMVWKEYVPAGTAVVAGESKKATQVTSSKTYEDVEFIKISYNKKEEGWMVPTRLSTEGNLTMVLTDCVVYRTENPASAASFMLSFGTYITKTDKQKKIGSLYLSEVCYFDPNSYTVKKGYIRSDKISTNDSDIKAMTIMAKVTDKQDVAVRNELLSTALGLKVSAPVFEYIQSADKKYNPDKYVEAAEDDTEKNSEEIENDEEESESETEGNFVSDDEDSSEEDLEE